MADNTTRYPDFLEETNFSQTFLVGYKDTDKKERRFSFEDLLTFLGYSDYSDDQIQTWLDAGFTWTDIGVFLLQRQNLKRDIAEPFIFSRVPSDQLDALIAYIKTAQGFAQTGIALCDGKPFVDNSGSSWNLKDRFIRAYAPNIRHDGQTILPYQIQEDAMQRLTGNFGVKSNEVSASGVFSATSRWYMNSVGTGLPGWLYNFDNSLVARTSSETRPKTIYFPYFQVVKKLDYRTINYKQPTALS